PGGPPTRKTLVLLTRQVATPPCQPPSPPPRRTRGAGRSTTPPPPGREEMAPIDPGPRARETPPRRCRRAIPWHPLTPTPRPHDIRLRSARPEEGRGQGGAAVLPSRGTGGASMKHVRGDLIALLAAAALALGGQRQPTAGPCIAAR